MPATVLPFAVFAILLAAAVYSDIRDRKIPNDLVMVGLLAGLVVGAVQVGGWPVAAVAGAVLGLAVGLALFALGALGAGDGKLLAVVGAFLGPVGLVMAVLYAGLAGGVLALADALRQGTLPVALLRTRSLALHLVTFGRRGERWTVSSPGAASIPYGVAIAAGAVAAWFLPLADIL